MSINRKRGSIASARSLCYQIAGAADDSDDMDGGGYGSVEVAEILSAEVERLREALAQPERCKPLDDWDIDLIRHNIGVDIDSFWARKFARAIEAAHGIKEQPLKKLADLGQKIEQEPTPWRDMVVVSLVREGIDKHRARELADHFAAQPEQEPVAWTTMPKAADWDFISGSKDPTNKLEGKWVPLYAAPPQRTWVGLTKVQRDDFADAYGSYEAVCAIEQRLKELNT